MAPWLNQQPLFKRSALSAAVISVLAAAHTAPVLSEEKLMLEEVVVTATKRDTSLMETGVAVSAFNADTLKDMNITSKQDLVQNTPSLTVGENDVNIRGVGRVSSSLGTAPGVGIYIDGLFSSELKGVQSDDFWDVEQIEVLRGPQGTLFGRSTVGGALSIKHAEPNMEEQQTRVRVDMGNYNLHTVQGMVNLPLNDRMAARLTMSEKKHDAFQDNSAGEDIQDFDSRNALLSLKADWNDSWSTLMRVGHIHQDYRPGRFNPAERITVAPASLDLGDGIGGYSKFINAPAITFLNYPYDPVSAATVNPNARDFSDVRQDFSNNENLESNNVSLTNEFQFDDYSLTYSVHYLKTHFQYHRDLDGTTTEDQPLNSIGMPSDFRWELTRDTKVWSHELVLTSDFDGPVNFIAGVNYYNEKSEDGGDGMYDALFDYRVINTGLEAGGVTIPLVDLGIGIAGDYVTDLIVNPVSDDYSGQIYSAYNKLEETSLGIFGQATIDLTDELMLTLGVRYTDQEKDGSDEVYTIGTTGCEENTVAGAGVIVGGPADGLDLATVTGGAAGDFAIAYENCKPVAHAKKQDWQETTWRAQLDWQVTDDALIYGVVSTGFKPGAIRLGENYSDDPNDVSEVDPETVTSYEIGYKGELFDNRLRITAAAFYYEWEDMQVLVDTAVGNLNVATFENASEASATGFELEMLYLATENWTIGGTYSFIDSQFDEFVTQDTNRCRAANLDNSVNGTSNDTTAACANVDMEGNSLTNMPENKFSLTSSYTIPTDFGDFVAQAAWSYLGSSYADAGNTDYMKMSGWHRADASITWFSPRDDLSVRLYGKNLTDDRELVGVDGLDIQSGSQGGSWATDPRTYGIQVDYTF